MVIKINELVGASPLKRRASSVSFSPSAVLAMHINKRTLEELTRALPGVFPSYPQLRNAKASIQFNHWTAFVYVDPLDIAKGVKKIDVVAMSPAEVKQITDVCLINDTPIELIKKELAASKQGCEREDLLNKVVLTGDGGQGFFSFGFFLPAMKMSRDSFHCLLYRRGDKDRETLETFGKALVDSLIAWMDTMSRLPRNDPNKVRRKSI